MQRFVRAEVANASAFYALLNEALASATYGLVSNDHATSNYRHTFIRDLAAPLWPVLQEALAKGPRLYQASRKLTCGKPTAKLGEMYEIQVLPDVGGDPSLDKAASAYQIFLREFEPVASSVGPWRLFRNLNLVFWFLDDLPSVFSTAVFPIWPVIRTARLRLYGTRDGQASLCISPELTPKRSPMSSERSRNGQICLVFGLQLAI